MSDAYIFEKMAKEDAVNWVLIRIGESSKILSIIVVVLRVLRRRIMSYCFIFER